MRVAVIGAGWAGLAAAVDLVAGGAAVTLFEAGRVPGGRARTIDLDGRRLDNGQHILLGAYRETLDLMRRVDADPDTLLERLPLQVVADDGFRLALPRLPAPFNVALGLLTARGVGRREKVDTALWMNAVQRRGFRLARDLSVAAWLDAAGQTGVLRHRLWEPLCLAALNTPASRASAQLFANVLRDSLGASASASDLLLPKVDLSELFPVPASRWLAMRGHTVRTAEPIKTIQPEGEYFRLDGDPWSTRYDHVVVATAPYHVAALVEPLPALAPVVARIDALRHEPIVTAWLAFDGPVKFPEPMIGMSGGYGQWAFDRAALGGPEGLVSVVISASGAHQEIGKEALEIALLQELQAILGPLPALKWAQIITEKRATFACTPGIERPRCATPHPGLWLAGDYVASEYPATIEAAVQSGVIAGRSILKRCGLREQNLLSVP